MHNYQDNTPWQIVCLCVKRSDGEGIETGSSLLISVDVSLGAFIGTEETRLLGEIYLC